MNIQSSSLHDYISDYIENRMDPIVKDVFEEYLEQNLKIKKFVLACAQGRKHLKSLPVIGNSGKFLFKNSETDIQDIKITEEKAEVFRLISLGISIFVTGLAITQLIIAD